MADVKAIQRLIHSYAARGEMLERSLSELYGNLRDYLVCEDDGRLAGTASLHVSWEDLAEIKSLAVAPGWRRRGVGTRLVRACLGEARSLGIRRVFALTYKPAFFEGQGFRRIDRQRLPHKVWTECVNCPKFPDCDEVALEIELGGGLAGRGPGEGANRRHVE